LRGGFCTLPRDILVSVEQHVPGGRSVEDYATLRRLLDLIKASADPNAGPAEVFGVIEEALRAYYATPVSG